MNNKNIVTSPVATGGAGVYFEQHVGAVFLSLLLLRAVPPIIINSSVEKVSFQTGHLGWETDDLLIEGKADGCVNKKLVVQIKKKFSVAKSNKDCQKTFKSFWNDFQNNNLFDKSNDNLVLITLNGTSKLLDSFTSLLNCAKGSSSEIEFDRRILLKGYISKEAKEQNNAIIFILTKHIKSAPNSNDYWKFLKVINIISYDLNTSTSHTEAFIKSLLSLSLIETTDSVATTWSYILQEVSRGQQIAKTYQYEDLPSVITNRHKKIPSATSVDLNALILHGNTVRARICSTIAGNYQIDKTNEISDLIGKLRENKLLVITGVAGSGKSTLANILLQQFDSNYPVIAFNAEEFAKPHIDETLLNVQNTINTEKFNAIISEHNQIFILVESVERLLEHKLSNAFFDFLKIINKNSAIRIVLTCRTYSAEIIQSSILDLHDFSYYIHTVLYLSDKEIEYVHKFVPKLSKPLNNIKLRSYLKTPYLLDMASRLNWETLSGSNSIKKFREKCWGQLIRGDSFSLSGMPDRRERMFIYVAHKRAVSLQSFIIIENPDDEALDSLVKDSILIKSHQSNILFAPTHDVLEDWAIFHALNQKSLSSHNPEQSLADYISEYPALRRVFRDWLDEQFKLNPNNALKISSSCFKESTIPQYFRDDCLMTALLSDSARTFVFNYKRMIKSGNIQPLIKIINILIVACKVSPPYLSNSDAPSIVMLPNGPGWVPVIQIISESIDLLLPKDGNLILRFIKDWTKMITIENHSPDGFKYLGTILDAFLPYFNCCLSIENTKLVLELILYIPHAVPSFFTLIQRATNCDRDDYIGQELAKLLLTNFGSATYVCFHFPDEMIKVANSHIKLTETETKSENPRFHQLNLGHKFCIREFYGHNCFPASSYQSFFFLFLQVNPLIALDYILGFINHAGEWYGTQKWKRNQREEVFHTILNIPNQAPVKQWLSWDLYGMYRGIPVGPYVLKSALMALEKWLLNFAETEEEKIEALLFYILFNSNNVMPTAVVASICVAYPEKAGKIALTLISNRDILQMDRKRIALESTYNHCEFHGIIPSYFTHENERKDSNSLPHRHSDLEYLALIMQQTEHKEDIWKIIDSHVEAISDDQDQETKIWKLALYRMDMRKLKLAEPQKLTKKQKEAISENLNYFAPNINDPSIREMGDNSNRSIFINNRHASLLNSAINAWKNKQSEDAKKWRDLLNEARAIEIDLDKPENFVRGGIETIAAVCIREHFEELDEDDLAWCVERVILEVKRTTYDFEDIDRVQISGLLRADRVCASVACLLVVHSCNGGRELLSIALTHPVEEVSRFAYEGVGAFLYDNNKYLAIQCASIAALHSKLIAEINNKQKNLPINEQKKWEVIVDITVPIVREIFVTGKLDISSEISTLDFDDAMSSTAISKILNIFVNYPDWEEARTFFTRIIDWLSNQLSPNSGDYINKRELNFDFKHMLLQYSAKFALKLPTDQAKKLCSPLFNFIEHNPNYTAEFLELITLFSDFNSNDCFWDLWQDIADRVVNSSWVSALNDKSEYVESLINQIFLGYNWKQDSRHWQRLEGEAYRLDELAMKLPAAKLCLEPYFNFLYSIGRKSLPNSFITIANLLKNDEAKQMVSNPNTMYLLETMLSSFIYSKPDKLKSDNDLRDAVLAILDILVDEGSSAAYQMRDDFATPLNSAPSD